MIICELATIGPTKFVKVCDVPGIVLNPGMKGVKTYEIWTLIVLPGALLVLYVTVTVTVAGADDRPKPFISLVA